MIGLGLSDEKDITVKGLEVGTSLLSSLPEFLPKPTELSTLEELRLGGKPADTVRQSRDVHGSISSTILLS